MSINTFVDFPYFNIADGAASSVKGELNAIGGKQHSTDGRHHDASVMYETPAKNGYMGWNFIRVLPHYNRYFAITLS